MCHAGRPAACSVACHRGHLAAVTDVAVTQLSRGARHSQLAPDVTRSHRHSPARTPAAAPAAVTRADSAVAPGEAIRSWSPKRNKWELHCV